MANKTPFDIKERTLEFAVRIVSFVNRLPKTIAGYELGRQLIRSGTSIGANVEEADGAVSKKDFINKIGIARKEARETRYWTKLMGLARLANSVGDKRELDWLLNESEELMKILSSIMNKAKRKNEK